MPRAKKTASVVTSRSSPYEKKPLATSAQQDVEKWLNSSGLIVYVRDESSGKKVPDVAYFIPDGDKFPLHRSVIEEVAGMIGGIGGDDRNLIDDVSSLNEVMLTVRNYQTRREAKIVEITDEAHLRALYGNLCVLAIKLVPIPPEAKKDLNSFFKVSFFAGDFSEFRQAEN